MGNKNHEVQSGVDTLGHTFHVVKKNAGFLWLGARVQVIENGKVTDEATVYGYTLEAMRRHQEAEADYLISRVLEATFPSARMGPVVVTDNAHIIQTNAKLAKRFQRPHPVE
ncbi:hypothetical protein A2363_00825 [Candidatus Gottesmanbacteria bacterium RIFOXYB1_FULL_47_11]|uniref:PAS domain-containing protein n=1 Tax=Candidatus Gottesmanbacteria bacterium RIFOXYB1_FULL_47_11 TaxID=1798401 RepID=A0A1F6BGV1_9BACT|nr:MAG: hypothetical protein A2363_00825 [Candidatus Gottesmanbacteria bacterium RIFOXYB1_FULL_47_11]